MKNAQAVKKMFGPIRNLFAEGRKIRYLEDLNASSNVSYLVRKKDGHIFSTSGICFGSLAGQYFTNLAFIIGPRYNYTYHDEADKAVARKYMNYVLKRSIFSKNFKNKNLSDALKHGVEVDCINIPRPLVLCTLAALRSCWERRAAEPFAKLLSLGFDEHRAFLLSSYVKWTGLDDKWFVYPSSHSHTTFTHLNFIDVKRVLNGTPKETTQGNCVVNSCWGGAHALFATAENGKNTIKLPSVERSLEGYRQSIEYNWSSFSAYDFSREEVRTAFFNAYNTAITNAYNA